MKTFEEIVFDTYDSGDFEPPNIEHVGSIYPEDLDHTGVTVVHRAFGDAVIRECLSPELELITVESPDLGDVRHTLLGDGSGHVIDEDTPHFSRAWGTDGVVHETILTNEPIDLGQLFPDDPN